MRTAEAEYGVTAQALDSMNGNHSNPDDRLRIQFGLFPEIDQAATTTEGRPIYKDAEYITIMIPGERDVVHRRVWEKDLERFPRQYAAFKNKQNQDAVSGTPLKMVPWLTLGQVKELEFFNCMTLEQLANMPDSTSAKFLQIQKLKQLAKDHLQAAKEAAPLVRMRAELDERDNQISTLQKQVADLVKAVENLREEAEA
jgi:hypothetical protein